MPYSPEQLDDIEDALDERMDREAILADDLLSHAFTSERGREFAIHGLARRLNLVRHCIERVFEVLPPSEEHPTQGQLLDATAYFQTFMINIFGAIDNIAHVWCHEKSITRNDGNQLSRQQIGLGSKHVLVRSTLSCEFRELLEDADEWFEYLNDYRHALAHRIPLYVVPRRLGPTAKLEFRELESQYSAAFRKRDWQAVDQISDKLSKVGVFEPWIMHSIIDGARPVWIHDRLISDFATVTEFGRQLLRDLQGAP